MTSEVKLSHKIDDLETTLNALFLDKGNYLADVTCVSVIKRLENVQVNLVDVSNKEELLSVSKSLRLQQEKAKELENQVNEFTNSNNQ